MVIIFFYNLLFKIPNREQKFGDTAIALTILDFFFILMCLCIFGVIPIIWSHHFDRKHKTISDK